MSQALARTDFYFETTAYTFQDKIKVNIYDDLRIHLEQLGIPET